MTQEWEAEVIEKVLRGRNPSAWLGVASNAKHAGMTLTEYIQARMDVYREAKKMGVLRVK